MSLKDTVEAADAVVLLLNAAGLTEGIVFERSFVPDFDVETLTSPKGLVFPAELTLAREDRTTDREDHSIEIGIGRRITNEDSDVVANTTTLKEALGVVRDKANRTIVGPVDGEEYLFVGAEARLLVPAELRKRVALSVIRVTYRGWE